MSKLDINRLQNLQVVLNNSKTALAAKGVSVPAGALLDDIPALIAQVPSGGAVLPTAQPKDVNFYDYDGSIRYSYTLEEAAALTALPALPTHSGLTGVGWNYSLEDVKATTNHLDVGAIYKSSDDKTHIKLALVNTNQLAVSFVVRLNGSIKVDWGDGSATETLTAQNRLTVHSTYLHTYSTTGIYEIVIETISGHWGGGYSAYRLFYVGGDSGVNITTNVTDVVLGTTHVSGPAAELYPILQAFNGTTAKRVIAPYVLQWEDSERTSFFTSGALVAVHLPHGITKVPASAFSECRALSCITLPKSVTSIGYSAFKNCTALMSLTMPSGLTSIGAAVFQGCSGIAVYDFTACQSVPTLANSNAFQLTRRDRRIIVPDALAAEWKEATNWATYADNIISASDYAALQNT